MGNETLAQRLIRLMESYNVSVRDAADVADVPSSTVQNWRSGSQPTDFLAVKRLASALGVSFSYLLIGMEDTAHNRKPAPEDVFSTGKIVFEGFAKIKIEQLSLKSNKRGKDEKDND